MGKECETVYNKEIRRFNTSKRKRVKCISNYRNVNEKCYFYFYYVKF